MPDRRGPWRRGRRRARSRLLPRTPRCSSRVGGSCPRAPRLSSSLLGPGECLGPDRLYRAPCGPRELRAVVVLRRDVHDASVEYPDLDAHSAPGDLDDTLLPLELVPAAAGAAHAERARLLEHRAGDLT